MYFWPGVIALWGALLAGLASIYFYFRADRGQAEALSLARSAYMAFATCIVAAAGTLMALLLQHRFDISYVNSYSSRDLPIYFLISTFWAGQEGVPALVLLGRDHRTLRLALGPRAGSACHDRLSLDLHRDCRDPLQAEPLQAASSSRAGRRRGLKPPAPGPMDGHPPARDVFGLRVAVRPVRLRDRRALEEALGRLGHPCDSLGALHVPGAGHGGPDGRLLGVGPGREHEPGALALHGGSG